jgi:hypothetical protein
MILSSTDVGGRSRQAFPSAPHAESSVHVKPECPVHLWICVTHQRWRPEGCRPRLMRPGFAWQEPRNLRICRWRASARQHLADCPVHRMSMSALSSDAIVARWWSTQGCVPHFIDSGHGHAAVGTAE